MRQFYRTTLFISCFLFGFVPAGISAQVQDGGVVLEKNVSETKITFSENRLLIENLPEDGVLEIFSIMGVKVYTKKIKAGTNEYTLNLPKGYYIIRIGNLVKKIALK